MLQRLFTSSFFSQYHLLLKLQMFHVFLFAIHSYSKKIKKNIATNLYCLNSTVLVLCFCHILCSSAFWKLWALAQNLLRDHVVFRSDLTVAWIIFLVSTSNVLQITLIFGTMCINVLYCFSLSFVPGLQHQDKSKESPWYWNAQS